MNLSCSCRSRVLFFPIKYVRSVALAERKSSHKKPLTPLAHSTHNLHHHRKEQRRRNNGDTTTIENLLPSVLRTRPSNPSGSARTLGRLTWTARHNRHHSRQRRTLSENHRRRHSLRPPHPRPPHQIPQHPCGSTGRRRKSGFSHHQHHRRKNPHGGALHPASDRSCPERVPSRCLHPRHPLHLEQEPVQDSSNPEARLQPYIHLRRVHDPGH